MAATIPDKGRGFGKKKAMEEEIKRMKDMAAASLLRKYENGYEAHLIDKHPHGKTYRDPHNPTDIVAFPEESIMLLTMDWTVVLFLNTIEDLNRTECELNLKRVL